MSIKEVARELYRVEKEIERIGGVLRGASPEEKKKLELRLKQLKTEKDRVRAVLEGMKQYPDVRKPR